MDRRSSEFEQNNKNKKEIKYYQNEREVSIEQKMMNKIGRYLHLNQEEKQTSLLLYLYLEQPGRPPHPPLNALFHPVNIQTQWSNKQSPKSVHKTKVLLQRKRREKSSRVNLVIF